MPILENIKREVLKAPLATAVSVLALVIALVGSPFDLGGFLNPEKPRVVLGSQFSKPNHGNGYGDGHFVTEMSFENHGSGEAKITAYVLLLQRNGQTIDVLNNDGEDSAAEFSLLAGTSKSIVATSDLRPTHLVACARFVATSSGEEQRFNAAYSLMNDEPPIDAFLKYRNAKIEAFANQQNACAERL